jgi:hypothetical protein
MGCNPGVGIGGAGCRDEKRVNAISNASSEF